MKKIIILMTAIVFLGAVAWGNSESESKGTLTIMRIGNNASGERDPMDDILDNFKAKYPNITIQEEKLSGEPYHQKLQARLQSGDVPHVVYAWNSQRSASLYLSGQAVDLTDYMDLSAFKSDLVKSKSPIEGIPPGVYMIPNSLGINSVMYVNTGLLKSIGAEIPKTYDDIVAMLPAIKEKGLTAIAMANADQWVMNSTLFGTIVARTTGNATWISEAMEGKHKFTDAPFVDSLTFIEKMYADGVLNKKSVSVDYGSALGSFMGGNAVFLIDGHWQVPKLEANPALFSQVEMIPFPEIPGEDASIKTAAAGSPTPGFTITQAALKDKETQKAALLLLTFLTNKDNALIRADKESLLPIRTDVDVSSLNKAGLSKKQAFYNAVAVLAETPDLVLTSKINEVLNSGLQEIGLGAKTPKEVAAAMEQAR